MELLRRNRCPASHILLLVHDLSKRSALGRSLGNVQSKDPRYGQPGVCCPIEC